MTTLTNQAVPDLFDDIDSRLGPFSRGEIEQRIAALEDELSRLRRILRAKKGGEATKGKPRRSRVAVEKLIDVYLACGGGTLPPTYGARRTSAQRLNVSERHLSRLIVKNAVKLRLRTLQWQEAQAAIHWKTGMAVSS